MAAPGYSYLTLLEARTALAARLEDPSFVYWTAAELNAIIVMAVRTWQALTGTYKQRASFNISPGGGIGGSQFYDLNESANILEFSVTDAEIIDGVLAALLEPPLSASWTGTGQFQFSQIVSALQNRINRWLGDTGANVAVGLENVTAGPSPAQVWLPEGVLDVRRVAWVSLTDKHTTIWRDDQYAMQAFNVPGYTTPQDPPFVWGKFTTPPVGIQLYPPPLVSGSIETLVVTSGPQIGTTPAAVYDSPTILDIPEDFVWGMTIGALSDLLSADGPMRDPERAQYCESRYAESAELYRMNPTLLQTQVNNVPIWSGSVFEMDAFLASWQSQTGPPQYAGMAGHNLVAFGPGPDTDYEITMDIACNIPIPLLDGDYVQVNRGAINPLLDYCEHLACFKMAGAEFQGKDVCRQNFYLAAALENSRITKGSFYKSAFHLPVLRQQAEVPRI